MLDELNAQLQPHGLRFAPDISTANRATIGGMIANNSSGARSVLYGKTIDHVLELEVVLADGERRPLRSARRAEADATCARTIARRRLLSGGAATRRTSIADEIERRYPEDPAPRRRLQPRRVRRQPDRPFNLAKLIVGSEGTLGVVVEAKLNLVPLPKAKAVLVDPVRRPARRARGDAGDPAPRAVGRRGHGQVHPRQHAS